MQTPAVFEQPMRVALELAARGRAVDPNPRVGCVIERDGVVVGRGWHEGAGTPHAEVVALREAGPKAQGATAYVTLEPCAHHGRTGPCVDALVTAGVTRVVHAQSDPNPVASGGAGTLRARGIEVVSGVLAADAQALNETWTFAVAHGRPWITSKFAMTIDGHIAASDGTSQWISNAHSRAQVHDLRRRVGAVVVGTGTALTDDPQLTARSATGDVTGRQPLRVVVGDRSLPAGARLLDDAAPTVHLQTHDVQLVLQDLHDRGIRSALLEGGARLAAAFHQAGAIDELVVFIGPKLLGAGPAAVADFGVRTLSDAATWTLRGVERLDDDIQLTYRRQ